MKTTGVLLVLAIAIALGYLLGTESGREQKEALLEKLGKTEGDLADAEAAAG